MNARTRRKGAPGSLPGHGPKVVEPFLWRLLDDANVTLRQMAQLLECSEGHLSKVFHHTRPHEDGFGRRLRSDQVDMLCEHFLGEDAEVRFAEWRHLAPNGQHAELDGDVAAATVDPEDATLTALSAVSGLLRHLHDSRLPGSEAGAELGPEERRRAVSLIDDAVRVLTEERAGLEYPEQLGRRPAVTMDVEPWRAKVAAPPEARMAGG